MFSSDRLIFRIEYYKKTRTRKLIEPIKQCRFFINLQFTPLRIPLPRAPFNGIKECSNTRVLSRRAKNKIATPRRDP